MQSSAIDQTLQEPGIRFDAAKLNWIGNPTVDNLVTIAGQGADPAGGDAVAAGRASPAWSRSRRPSQNKTASDA
jgi:hypothetical protein